MAANDIRVLQEQADGTFKEILLTRGTFSLGTGDAVTFGSLQGTPIGSTTSSTGAFTTLRANNGTITASAPVLDLSQTWNNSGVTFTGLLFNVTNTASSASSILADFQIGGTTINRIERDGFIGNANAGINTRATGSSNRLSLFSQGDTRLLHNNNILLNEANGGYGWVSSGSPTSLAFDTGIFRGGAGIIEQRKDANAQQFRIYNTYTSATNHERGFLRWSSNNFEIGSEAGSGGGTAREVRILAGTSTYRFATNSNAIFPGTLTIAATAEYQWFNRSIMSSSASGIILITNSARNDWSRLQFGGTTSSFPSLKRSSTVLQSRLADDSDFSPLQGQLRTHANAVSETITATHTLTLYDAAGTAYKVPCVAA